MDNKEQYSQLPQEDDRWAADWHQAELWAIMEIERSLLGEDRKEEAIKKIKILRGAGEIIRFIKGLNLSFDMGYRIKDINEQMDRHV